MDMTSIQQKYLALGIGTLPRSAIERAMIRSGSAVARTTEVGSRANPENSLKYLYRMMWVDSDLRAAILDIRDMDRKDPRVKKVHGRTARAAIKGGLQLRGKDVDERLRGYWLDFSRRLHLDRREKLESDMRGCMMEGNLPLQWVLNGDGRVVRGIRMPAETILPRVNRNGLFIDPKAAYEQYDLSLGAKIATFAAWQLTMTRLTPDNHDDLGSLGRPYLDATRTVWRKLSMTEEDLVIRRRERAPLRTSHVLEGAQKEELEAYKEQVEVDQTSITTNYYLNKKGGVTALQGDANLDQIADVIHLLDTFFSGSPAPKGLFGYVGDLSRDILEDLKRDFYDELDSLQDTVAWAYQQGFALDLLMRGVNPDDYQMEVIFSERRTETPNMAADRALKQQAMGFSRQTVIETAGGDYATETARREDEAKRSDPYPDPGNIGATGTPRVAVTPGNAPKGESATTISTRSGRG